MKADVNELLIVFDELLIPPTNEEQGVFWFRSVRADGLIVTFSFSIFENYVGILIRNGFDTAIANIHMKNCYEVRVLDENKRQLEIVHENSQSRCFLDLFGDDILNYTE
jgi:hypothetical protein